MVWVALSLQVFKSKKHIHILHLVYEYIEDTRKGHLNLIDLYRPTQIEICKQNMKAFHFNSYGYPIHIKTNYVYYVIHMCTYWYLLQFIHSQIMWFNNPFFRFENMTSSTMTFLVPGFLFFFVIQLAVAMEEISISQNSTLKNHTVSSLLLNT